MIIQKPPNTRQTKTAQEVMERQSYSYRGGDTTIQQGEREENKREVKEDEPKNGV